MKRVTRRERGKTRRVKGSERERESRRERNRESVSEESDKE